MKALFNGHCHCCGKPILKGTDIVRSTPSDSVRIKWIHADCAGSKPAPQPKAKKEKKAKVVSVPTVKVEPVKIDLPDTDVGHEHPKFRDIVAHLSIGEHVYLAGPKGSGKSTIARKAAKFFGLPYAEIGFTAGTTEGAIFGRPSGLTDEFLDSDVVVKWETGGLICFDELDRADANVACSLQAGLTGAETFSLMKRTKRPYAKKHETTRVVATANTFGMGADRQYVGASQLDGATMDRFTIIQVDYDETLEAKLCPDEELLMELWRYRQNIRNARLERCIGTRQIAKAFNWKTKLGKDLPYIQDTLFAGWRRDEISKTIAG